MAHITFHIPTRNEGNGFYGTAWARGRGDTYAEEAWATARMLWSELLEKAYRAYDRATMKAAVKNFKPGRYRLPEAPVQPAKRSEDGIPKSCPYSREYLERAARESPSLIPCPATKRPWWWMEKSWCVSKCTEAHPDCIRHIFWSDTAAEGVLQ